MEEGELTTGEALRRSDPLVLKLADILGSRKASSGQRALAILRVLRAREVPPERRLELLRFVLESCGLAPKHQGTVAEDEIPTEVRERVTKTAGARIDHELKGWFEIRADRPLERKVMEIWKYLQEWEDERERAVVLERILASPYIPVPASYFSRFVDDGEKDQLILRQHAPIYIQLRQAINMRLGPTAKGALLQDFLAPLAKDPYAQAVVLGAFVEDLRQRIKKAAVAAAPQTPGAGVFSFPLQLTPEQIREALKRLETVLPPEILDQLRKLFPPGEGDEWHRGPA